MKTIKNLKAEEIRKSILQLAIQGKLVKQDPNDEPASELVKRIYAEKQKLIAEGKIKKDKTESYIFKGDDNCYYEKIGNNEPVRLEDLPFDIPSKWIWCNAKAILRIVVGATPSTSNYNYWDGDICWLPSGCCQDCEVTENYPKRKYITKLGYESCSTTMMAPNTVLIALTGATAGKVGLLKFNACANQSVVGVSQYYGINPEFLFFQFMARRREILSDCIGSAQPHISKDYIEKMYLAIPPLEEQLRIVDKIKSCEPLINQYSIAEQKLSNLESEFPEKLKKSILQYAIEGKLVKQDPNDEPASVLLERIKAEKEKLIKEGKIKRDKNESYIYQGDDKNYYGKFNGTLVLLSNLFQIPESWQFIKLSDVIEVARGGSPRPIQRYLTTDDNGINWIKISDTNINNKYITSCKEKILKSGLCKSRFVHKGDFLLTNSMSFGHPYILAIDGCIHDGWLVLSNNYNAYDKEFLYYLLSSPHIYKTFCSNVEGSVVKNLNSSKVSNTIIPLLSIREQKEIVFKIEKIFNYLNIY